MIEFKIPTEEDMQGPGASRLFGPVPIPTHRAHIEFRNNPAAQRVALRVKSRYLTDIRPDVRETLALVMHWLEDAATPPEEQKKQPEADDEDGPEALAD